MRLAALFIASLPLFAVEPVIERSQPSTIYALGDIHGDFERMSRLLRTGGVVDGHGAWAARDSVLIVTGDMIDKGPRGVEVLRYLAALRKTAPAQGGQVILLAGNHEAEFMAGPDTRKAADFLSDLKHWGITPADVIACKGDVGETMCSLPYAARIGDWFFSHAGNTAGRGIPQILEDLRGGLAAQGYTTKQLLGADSILEARLGEGKGEWIVVAGKSEHDVLASYAKALGVLHIVQGHQHNAIHFDDGVDRAAGEMFQRWGLLFLIDVGMSTDIGGSAGALLEIRTGTATAICPDGARTLLWSEKVKQETGRALCGSH